MPPKLRIPKEDFDVLERLTHLSSKEYQDLVEAIRVTPVVASPGTFTKDVASKVDSLPEEVTTEIVDLLHMFGTVIANSGIAISDYTGVLSASLEEIGREEFHSTDTDWTGFQQRLSELLGIESLRLEVKALNLRVGHERTYHDVSVITEILPVFRDNPEEPVTAAFILHTLALKFHCQGEVQTFEVVLDQAGINGLRRSLNRAESKAKNLQQLLTTGGVTVLREEPV